MQYIVCDLDGCVSDDRWRRPLLPAKGDANYDAYHSLGIRDDVVRGVMDEVVRKATEHHAEILFVTARPEYYRPQTTQWIEKAVGDVAFKVLMRPNDDHSGSPDLKVRLLNDFFSAECSSVSWGWMHIIAAYDDREDVLKVYPIGEHIKFHCDLEEIVEKRDSVPDILVAMASTFRERNAVYGDNYLRVAPIIKVLWPEGVPPELVVSDRWHLFELLVVKLTRFAISDLTHQDSIHDAAVYAAMIESDIRRKE